MSVLVFNTFLIILNKPLFYLSSSPSKHFAHRIYEPYLLAKQLKSKRVTCYDNAKGREIYQLQYYGIYTCSN